MQNTRLTSTLSSSFACRSRISNNQKKPFSSFISCRDHLFRNSTTICLFRKFMISCKCTLYNKLIVFNFTKSLSKPLCFFNIFLLLIILRNYNTFIYLIFINNNILLEHKKVRHSRNVFNIHCKYIAIVLVLRSNYS